MEEQMNLSQLEAIEVANTFPLEPTFSKVVVTINTDEQDGLMLEDSNISEVQYVIAKGEHARVELGQKVLLDLEKMKVRQRVPNNQDEIISQVQIDPIFHDGRLYAIIEDRLIKAKYKLENND